MRTRASRFSRFRDGLRATWGDWPSAPVIYRQMTPVTQVLSNLSSRVPSLTGRTQFVTFYQSFTNLWPKKLLELSSAFCIHCRRGACSFGPGSGRKRAR